MNLTIYNQFEQRTPLWHLARLGMPTVSCFDAIMRVKKDGKPSVDRDKYLCELGAELVNLQPKEGFRSRYTDRGVEQEAEALKAYQEETGFDIERAAFVRMDDGYLTVGASPDGLVGRDGGVEIKTLEPWLMFRLRRAPDVPAEHRPQLYGSMWVTGRQWWDFVAYSPGFPLFVRRMQRDDAVIADIEAKVRGFSRELGDEILKQTGETITTARKRHLERLREAMEEEGNNAEVAADPAGGDQSAEQPAGVAADLQASLARG